MSASIVLPRPGIRFGDRPEKRVPPPTGALVNWLANRLDRTIKPPRSLSQFDAVYRRILAEEARIALMDIAQRKVELQKIRQLAQRGELEHMAARTRVFGMIRHAISQTLGLQLHTTQCYAGWCMMQGVLVEMQTGEGKTLAAALPAIAMALAGVPVHVVTANDYLAGRDAETLRTLYHWFDIRVGVIADADDETARRRAYAADITYCTHQQLVFDYLRDRQAMGALGHGSGRALQALLLDTPVVAVQRGLCFAILDEADSILLDDARTPLILAETEAPESGSIAEAAVALTIADKLQPAHHFAIDRETQAVTLTREGRQEIARLSAALLDAWTFERYRRERVRQALVALHVLRRDHDYVVNDRKLTLIDSRSGRVLPDRRLQNGLQLLLELKEHCEPSAESHPVRALSYQQFFPRYHRLTGMSGTLTGARHELLRTYGISVCRIPTRRPSRRRHLPILVFPTRLGQLERVTADILARRNAGQAVLVGTRSIALSERLSQVLHEKGIDHHLLNANRQAREAEIIALAGRTGAVTIATNMAGRGTDIRLEDDTARAGGLHVMNLEINDSPRVDRQLEGRAARQGDPGSCQSILCLEDPLLQQKVPERLIALAQRQLRRHPATGRVLARALIAQAKRRTDKQHRRERLRLQHGQARVQRMLAFDGEN